MATIKGERAREREEKEQCSSVAAVAPLARSLPRTGRGNEPELLFEKLGRGFGDRRPSASSAKDPCSPREKTVANAGNMLSINLFHSGGFLNQLKANVNLSASRTITWRTRDSMLVSDGIAGQTDTDRTFPLQSTRLDSRAFHCHRRPFSPFSPLRSLSDEWRARFFDTFEIYRPSDREGEGVLEKGSIREWMGVKEGKAFDSMSPMSSGLE